MVSVVLFVICYLWSFLLTDPTIQERHLMTFRILFLDAGFVGLNFMTFVASIMLSYIGGLFIGFILTMCLNHCQKWFP